MRVLLTTDTIGGVWTFTRELTLDLLKRGHAVALVSFGRTPSPAQVSWCAALKSKYGRSFRYDPSPVPLEWMNANELAYDAALPLLLKVIHEFLPDLIHANQFCFGNLPLSLPVVITAHSDVLSWADACRPNGLEPSAWLEQYCFLVEEGLKAATAVVAPTRWMLNALCEHFQFAPPAHVIFNGRNLPPMTSMTSMKKRLQAISVGRFWDETKNLSLLSNLHAPMPILIAGEQRYENASAPNHLDNLELLGALEEPELLSVFHESSIYIAPSRYEPFGLAPLEAAQCDCAVLANDIPSFREIWGDAALYFQDAATLSRLLDHLYHANDQLLYAQKRSAQRARQLTATRMADSYVALYNDLLGTEEAPEQELATHAR